MNWLLVITLAMLAGFGFNGYRQGFVRTVFSMVSIVLTIVLVGFITPYISHFVEEKTPLFDMVKSGVTEKLLEESGSVNINTAEEQSQAVESYRMPTLLKDLILDNNNEQSYRILGAEDFKDFAGSYLAHIIINAMSFLVAFIIITIFLRMTIFTLDAIANLPVIRGVNKITGLIVGLGEGMLVIWIMFLAITAFSKGEGGKMLYTMIDSSEFLKILYNNNYILKFISALAGLMV